MNVDLTMLASDQFSLIYGIHANIVPFSTPNVVSYYSFHLDKKIPILMWNSTVVSSPLVVSNMLEDCERGTIYLVVYNFKDNIDFSIQTK